VNQDNGKKQPHPKPPRSAFMCFTDAKRKEMSEHGSSEKDVLRLVAKEWRELSAGERADWDEVAREDKVRYVDGSLLLIIL